MPLRAEDYITLNSDNGGTVRALRGSDAPQLISGWGGWEVTDRPKRVGATNWRGRDPMRLRLPLLFDGWRSGGNVEEEIVRLEAMAGGQGGKPPIITLQGTVPRKELDWVIETMDYGNDVIANASGRMRQDVVVNLLQHVKDVRVLEQVTNPGIPATYRVKSGESLQKIANRFYGNPDNWYAIADMNNIRDPAHIKAGTVITLP